jgi:hypothetical protein
MKTVQVEQSATAGTLALADNAKFNDILNRSRARARREGWLSTEQVRRQLGVE